MEISFGVVDVTKTMEDLFIPRSKKNKWEKKGGRSIDRSILLPLVSMVEWSSYSAPSLVDGVLIK